LLHVAVGDVTVYWLCWMETGQMWIYILWTICGLFNETYYAIVLYKHKKLLIYLHCHNGSRLYYGYTSWKIHSKMNWPGHYCNRSTRVTLTIFFSIFSKWTVQCVHLHNIQLNSASTWLHSHNWIEQIEVDNWMQKFEYTCILQICMSIFNTLHQFQFYSCYQYYTAYIWHDTVVFTQAALPKNSVYKCSVLFVYRSSAWCCTRNGQTVWGGWQ